MQTPNKNLHKFITYAFLILAQVMVGINIVSSKYLIATTPFLFLLTIRFLIATLILLALHWLADHSNAPVKLTSLTKNEWMLILLQALCAGVLFNLLLVWGLSHSDATSAGIITSALPALIAVLSFILLKEKFTGKKALCVAFATLGLIVTSANNLKSIDLHHSMLGDGIILLALIPEASYYVLTKLYTNRLPIFLISAILNGINALILLPIMLLHVNFNLLILSPHQWFILFIVGLSSGLFYVFWYIASSKVDSVMASLSTSIMPIATLTLAWLALGEMINLMQFIGMGFVIGSIVAYALA